MTEAQEVAAAFIAGDAGFPALIWLAHNAEQRIRISWEKTLRPPGLSPEPASGAAAGTPALQDGEPKCRNSTWNGPRTPKSPT